MRKATVKTIGTSVNKFGSATVTVEDIQRLTLIREAKANGWRLVIPLDGTWVLLTTFESVGSDQYEVTALFFMGTLRETPLTLRGQDLVTVEMDKPTPTPEVKAEVVAETPKKKRPVYVQTPDGVTHKRVTDRVYTHAIAALWPKGWVILSYCGSADLAAKAAAKAKGANIRVLPVVVALPEVPALDPVKVEAATLPALPERPQSVARMSANTIQDTLTQVLSFVRSYTQTFTGDARNFPTTADVAARFTELPDAWYFLKRLENEGSLIAFNGRYDVTGNGVERLRPIATPERFEVRAEVFQVPGDYRLKDEDGADLEPGYYLAYVVTKDGHSFLVRFTRA